MYIAINYVAISVNQSRLSLPVIASGPFKADCAKQSRITGDIHQRTRLLHWLRRRVNRNTIRVMSVMLSS